MFDEFHRFLSVSPLCCPAFVIVSDICGTLTIGHSFASAGPSALSLLTMASSQSDSSASVTSFLDTDLYKLTMQCAILRYFPDVPVEYTFTNRTPDQRLSHRAFKWLQDQVEKLGNIRLSDEEQEWLRKTCPYLKPEYLAFLKSFSLKPKEQVILEFTPLEKNSSEDSDVEQVGDVSIHVKGLWIDTILYEIPLLALTSEAYFKFVDRDWDDNYADQEQRAYEKGLQLFQGGCMVSEFGSRRRRDRRTHDNVVAGLKRASEELNRSGGSGVGKLIGTSNVFFAMKHGIPPVGTVAHEWYMGIASIKDDYVNANELGLKYWVEHFGEGVLGIALTDTFGTPAFFRAFQKRIILGDGEVRERTYAEAFTGIRQDSGDPKDYVKMASDFYNSVGISGKSIVFSDSLNVEKCLEYKTVAEQHGLKPSFGVGTFFTNDYRLKSDKVTKSKPMNIVIKISKADGRPSIKISDNIGKNTGDKATVRQVKQTLGYSEHEWRGVDESKRW